MNSLRNHCVWFGWVIALIAGKQCFAEGAGGIGHCNHLPPRNEIAPHGWDLQRIFDYVREREGESAARGMKFVPFAEAEHGEPLALIREDPPQR